MYFFTKLDLFLFCLHGVSNIFKYLGIRESWGFIITSFFFFNEKLHNLKHSQISLEFSKHAREGVKWKTGAFKNLLLFL